MNHKVVTALAAAMVALVVGTSMATVVSATTYSLTFGFEQTDIYVDQPFDVSGYFLQDGKPMASQKILIKSEEGTQAWTTTESNGHYWVTVFSTPNVGSHTFYATNEDGTVVSNTITVQVQPLKVMLTLTGPSTVYAGQPFTVSGRLWYGRWPLAGNVHIYHQIDTQSSLPLNVYGSGGDILNGGVDGSVPTDANGYWSATIVLNDVGRDYHLFAYCHYGETPDGSLVDDVSTSNDRATGPWYSPQVRLLTTNLVATAQQTLFTIGQPITVTGTYMHGLEPLHDKMIALYQQSDNTLLGGAVTDATGNFTATIPARSTRGDLTFYARSEDSIESAPVTVHIVTALPSIAPYVTATPHTVEVGQPITLSASVANPGGVILSTPQWTVTPPSGVSAPAVTVNADNTATFTPTEPGRYTASVSIPWTDDATSETLGTLHAETEGSAAGAIMAIVSPTIQSVTATPNPTTLNHQVTLSAVLSNNPSEVNPYQWKITPPEGVTAPVVTVNADNTATFAPTVQGVYSADVTIEWGWGTMSGTLHGTVQVTVSNDQTVSAGTTATLDGSQASDPSGTLYHYAWTIDSAPTGSAPVLSNSNAAETTLTTDTSGDYVIGLSVTDDAGKSVATAQYTITVTPTKASAVIDVQKVIERSGGATVVSAAFSSSSNYKAYTNKLDALAKTIAAGDYADAQAKIQNDLLKRNEQWVTDPVVKARLDAQLQYILAELKALQKT